MFNARRASDARPTSRAGTPTADDVAPDSYPVALRVWRLPSCTSGNPHSSWRRCPLSLVSRAYSISSSAAIKMDCRTARPSAFAVCTLMTNSNFVGRRTGTSVPGPRCHVGPLLQTKLADARMDIQINLWSPAEPAPQPGICPRGSCRRDIYPWDICLPALRPAEAEVVGGRQQLLFPRRLEKRRPGLRISTSKSLR
jgi:hypothetical protein